MSALPPTYRAYAIERYGKTLEQIKLLADLVHAPLEPHQVRIRVHSAALNPVDHKMIEMGAVMLPAAPSYDRPLILGMDVAGTVVEIGSAAKSDVEYSVGDAVFGFGTFKQMGTFAEYAVLDAKDVIRKPTKLSFNEAAGFPLVAVTSYQALMKAKLQPGARVLVLGGATATGSLGIQIAKALGASFIATTASPRNIEYVKSFHPDQVIDYTKHQWYEVLAANSIDIIYECGVEPDAWTQHAHKVLKESTGVFVTVGRTKSALSYIFKFVMFKINPWSTEMPPFEASFSTSPIGAIPEVLKAEMNASDLTTLRGLVEEAKIWTPIDSVFPFEEFEEAMKKQLGGKAQGKIVIEVIPEKA